MPFLDPWDPWKFSIYIHLRENHEHLSKLTYSYSIFTYIYLISMVNVGKYSIHGSKGFLFVSPTILNVDQETAVTLEARNGTSSR